MEWQEVGTHILVPYINYRMKAYSGALFLFFRRQSRKFIGLGP
jgi:hypothetical protein